MHGDRGFGRRRAISQSGCGSGWGSKADAAQRRVLRTGARRVILNCTRQWGKSTVTAAKAVHEAWTQAGSLTLVVSPSARQSGEFVRKAEEFVRRLGMRVKGDGDNEISVAFAERVADCGAAGERGHGARVFGGEPAAGGRGGAGERRTVPGGAADAGGERRERCG